MIGKKNVSRDVRRSLTLVAKVLQQLGNGVEFGRKEEVSMVDVVRACMECAETWYSSWRHSTSSFWTNLLACSVF